MHKVWIATLMISQFEDLVGKPIQNGAYTNGVVLALDSTDALSQMSIALREMGFSIESFENLQVWEQRFPEGGDPYDEVLKEAYLYVVQTGQAEFGEFFCY